MTQKEQIAKEKEKSRKLHAKIDSLLHREPWRMKIRRYFLGLGKEQFRYEVRYVQEESENGEDLEWTEYLNVTLAIDEEDWHDYSHYHFNFEEDGEGGFLISLIRALPWEKKKE